MTTNLTKDDRTKMVRLGPLSDLATTMKLGKLAATRWSTFLLK